MDRRQFLKNIGVWGAGLAVSGSALHTVPEIVAEEQPQKMSILSVAEGADYHALVSTVLAPLGGMNAFV